MFRFLGRKLLMATAIAAPLMSAQAANQLIATSGTPGTYSDLSSDTAGTLENGVPGNRLGGIGSSITYAGGTRS